MRLIAYDRIEHRLSERNWKQMLRRFDASRASLNTFGYYFIPGKSICVARSYKCLRCPLRDSHKKINSCTYLFEKIIGEDLLQHVHLRDSGILWDSSDDTAARLALQRVSGVLSGAVQIKKRGTKKVKSGSRTYPVKTQ